MQAIVDREGVCEHTSRSEVAAPLAFRCSSVTRSSAQAEAAFGRTQGSERACSSGTAPGHMAGVIRAGKLASRLSQAASLQSQQTRSVGNLPVKPDKYIEAWAAYREHIPFANGFKFDARTLFSIAIWAGAFPYFLYTVSSAELKHTDVKYNRKPREML